MDRADSNSPKQSELVIVYMTLPDEASARRVAEALVRARLAACVNIHPPMASLYEWEGRLETAAEIAVFIKTRWALVDQVMGIARALHPYDTPCFLVLPIESANPDYLAWALKQTEPRKTSNET